MSKKDEIRLPWLKWYPEDWRNSLRVRKLTPLARLCYRELLDYCFMRGGFRDDLEDIRYICMLKTTKNLDKWWEEIKAQGFFYFDGALWRNAKMEYIRGGAETRIQEIFDAQIVTPPTPALGWTPPPIQTISDRVQTASSEVQAVSDTLQTVSTSPNSIDINPGFHQIREDSLEKDKVNNRLKDNRESLAPSEPSDTRFVTNPSFQETQGTHPADVEVEAEAEAEDGRWNGSPDTTGFKPWCISHEATDEFEANEEIWHEPVPRADLLKELDYLMWKNMRCAATPPSASPTEVMFWNPWQNPHMWGNEQNLYISLMDRHNQLCKLPGVDKHIPMNTKDYKDGILGFVQFEQRDNPASEYTLKWQMAQEWLAHRCKDFQLNPVNYFGKQKLNFLEEHAAKALDRHQWGKQKKGIPMVIPVELDAEIGIEWRPAMVWSIRRKDENHQPVYVLLDPQGNLLSNSYTEMEFKWNGYKWPFEKKGKSE